MCMYFWINVVFDRLQEKQRIVVKPYIVLRFKDSEHSTAEMLTLTCPHATCPSAKRKKKLDKPCRSDTTAKGLKVEDGVIDDSVWKNTLWAMAYCTRISSILNALETVYSNADIVKASLPLERIVKACRPLERI